MSAAQTGEEFSASFHDLVKVRLAKAEAKADAKEEVERLSRLDVIECAQELKAAAERLGLTRSELRKFVDAARQRRRKEETAEAARHAGEAPPDANDVRWPRGFTMAGEGLLSQPAEEIPPVWVCGPFEVLGEARNPQGEGWAKWIRWKDADGRTHEAPVETRLLYTTNGELEGRLADWGLAISADPKVRGLLRQALAGVRSGARATLVSQPGWAAFADGSRGYVFPNGEAAGEPAERLILHPIPENGRGLGGMAGSLDGWQSDVAALAVGNTPVVFCLSAAFAGPLLAMVVEVSGGVHLVGASKTGKSLAARLAVSVWGLPFEEGAFRSWNTTVNAMETTAAASNDGLLMLDEIHQAAAPDKVVKAIYLLANGGGKDRMSRDAMGRARRSWQTFVLSTGEKDVAAIAAEARQRVPAGADVRLPCIRTEAYNTWPELHGYANLEKLAAALCGAMREHHGTAGRAFVARLAQMGEGGRADLLRTLDAEREWMLADLPAAACAQVRDVARRFALVAFAGRLATEWGILPWEEGTARVAARAMLRRWMEARGGTEASEDMQAVEAIRAFLLSGDARFTRLWRDDAGRWHEADPNRPVANRVGWRRPDGLDGHEFLIPSPAWKAECARLGLDPTNAARTLKNKGYLRPGEGNHLPRNERIPGSQKPMRVYCIGSKVFGEDGEA
jgi:hypothetical protein